MIMLLEDVAFPETPVSTRDSGASLTLTILYAEGHKDGGPARVNGPSLLDKHLNRVHGRSRS